MHSCYIQSAIDMLPQQDSHLAYTQAHTFFNPVLHPEAGMGRVWVQHSDIYTSYHTIYSILKKKIHTLFMFMISV